MGKKTKRHKFLNQLCVRKQNFSGPDKEDITVKATKMFFSQRKENYKFESLPQFQIKGNELKRRVDEMNLPDEINLPVDERSHYLEGIN